MGDLIELFRQKGRPFFRQFNMVAKVERSIDGDAAMEIEAAAGFFEAGDFKTELLFS